MENMGIVGECDRSMHEVLWLDDPSSPGAVQTQRVKWAQTMTAPVNIK